MPKRYFTVLFIMARREAKPKRVRERDVWRICAPESDVTRTRSRFMCSKTSLMSSPACVCLSTPTLSPG